MAIIKTELLNFVIGKADELAAADGRNWATSNYFVMATILLSQQSPQSRFPVGMDASKANKELDHVIKKLSEIEPDLRYVYNSIHRSVTSENYHSAIDEIAYGRMKFAVESVAEKLKAPVADLDLFMMLVIRQPSDAIQEAFGIEPTSDENEDPKNAKKAKRSKKGNGGKKNKNEKGTDNDLDEILEKLGGESSEEAEEKAEEAPDPQKLITAVSDTRRIQNILLENIYGQDQAINSFVSGFFQAELMSFSRKENRKPQALFLFAGPPGVGKTFLAETAAKALGRPYMRFDMSEYSDKEANFSFCGLNSSYKDAKPGNVTGFVAENPRSVLLFDEVEKAHLNIIHLFLQLLDAGRLRDSYTEEEVSFKDCVIIFTTNVGRKLYNDPSITNLSALPKKTVLKALEAEINPTTGAPLFPAAICSRFAAGTVVMFNHLAANNLYTIAKSELQKNVKGFTDSTGIEIEINDRVSTAILFSEGGKADARTINGRANAFFHSELYELFRLLATDQKALESIKRITVDVDISEASDELKAMFVNNNTPSVLIFADKKLAKKCQDKLEGVTVYTADTVEDAKEILFNNDVSIVLCDVKCKIKKPDVEYLNAEDISSEGHDFLSYLFKSHTVPVYLLEEKKDEISTEEFLSFAKLGIRDMLSASEKKNDFCESVLKKCDIAYQQANMLKLARANKVLTYKTAQVISGDKTEAAIQLFNFKLGISADAGDTKNMLDGVSKPNLHFDDVIGAKGAKEELKYFVNYLKDPIKFMRKGVRAPRGVLLYGPPGTGKTLLAKAMAGESDVTFIHAEGNSFLKSYVGEGANALHDIFNTARKYAPSIIFIDEIDSIAKVRGQSQGGYDASDVINALLTEMDGFNVDTTRPVFVLAATNYDVEQGSARSLDPAVLRRFDRKIYVALPDKEERKQYIKMKIAKYSGTVNISEEEINNIAIRSTGMSLDDLESVFEMALRNAIRSESGVVTDAEFEEAFETFNYGDKKTWDEDSLKSTARHEAGHALLCKLGGEMPSYLTIVARGSHGGYMQHGDTENKGTYSKKELLARIRTSLAGRAAEILYYGDEDGVTTGASGDLANATRLAENMICAYGMDTESGLACVSKENRTAIRARVNEILKEQMELTFNTVKKHKAVIDKLVDDLLVKNQLRADELKAIFDKFKI